MVIKEQFDCALLSVSSWVCFVRSCLIWKSNYFTIPGYWCCKSTER